MRAQANMAMAASGIMGIYIPTRSPFFTPNSLKTFAI